MKILIVLLVLVTITFAQGVDYYKLTQEETNQLSQTEVKMEKVEPAQPMNTPASEYNVPLTELIEAKLVSFGNYLLSQERADMISEENKNQVTHADLANWKDSQ